MKNMKGKSSMKNNRILTAILATLMLASALASCSRRDQFRPPETDTPTGEQTTVAGQPDGNTPTESTPHETAPGGEEVTKPNSPDGPPTFAPPLSDGTETPKITGNPYEGWTAEELYASFMKEEERSETYESAYYFYNTPYYVLFDVQYGGHMFSKLTGQVIQICKDPICDHESCIFSNYTLNLQMCQVVDDRIYIVVTSVRDNYKRIMYSFDLLMNDSKVVGEWSDYIQGMYVYRDKVYYITGVDLDNGLTGYGAMTYDMKEKTTAPLWDQAEPCYTIRFDGSYAWYTPMESGSLRRYNLDTGEDELIISGDLLDREKGESGFVYDSGGEKIAYVEKWIFGGYSEYYELDMETGELRERNVDALEYDGNTYVEIRLDKEEYKDDPHYEYYFNNTTSGIGVRYGGKLYRKDAATGELEMVYHFQTEGIPDCIQGTQFMDGKFILVQYQTYKDFRNPYNESAPEWAHSYRFIVFDMETGQAYELGVDISTQSMHNHTGWY